MKKGTKAGPNKKPPPGLFVFKCQYEGCIQWRKQKKDLNIHEKVCMYNPQNEGKSPPRKGPKPKTKKIIGLPNKVVKQPLKVHPSPNLDSPSFEFNTDSQGMLILPATSTNVAKTTSSFNSKDVGDRQAISTGTENYNDKPSCIEEYVCHSGNKCALKGNFVSGAQIPFHRCEACNKLMCGALCSVYPEKHRCWTCGPRDSNRPDIPTDPSRVTAGTSLGVEATELSRIPSDEIHHLMNSDFGDFGEDISL